MQGLIDISFGRLPGNCFLSDRVRFINPVEHEQMPRYYSVADILVLASEREGWANVLLESMACGTPVVATRVGGTPEVVADPSAGLLIDERTPEAIANGVRSLSRPCLIALQRAATRSSSVGTQPQPGS